MESSTKQKEGLKSPFSFFLRSRRCTITLVELIRLWKNKELTEKEVIEEYKKIKMFKPIEEDGEIYYTNGNGNSWLEARIENDLTSQDIRDFKILVGEIKK